MLTTDVSRAYHQAMKTLLTPTIVVISLLTAYHYVRSSMFHDICDVITAYIQGDR
jgi:hypothetical protein